MSADLHAEPSKETHRQIAALFNISLRGLYLSKRILRRGIPELVEAVEAGRIKTTVAASISLLPPEDQREALAMTNKQRTQLARVITQAVREAKKEKA